jgi:predicted RNase H-like HicB family nuclease
MHSQFTAVYQKRGRRYIAYVEEIPGVNTQGRRLKEARENLREALELILAANRELSARQQQGAAVLRESLVLEVSR